jgi:hypothetical protein
LWPAGWPSGTGARPTAWIALASVFVVTASVVSVAIA